MLEKGHEENQIYKNKIINISDKKIVKQIKIKSKIFSKKNKNFAQNKLALTQILGKKISVNFNGLSIDTRTIKKNNLFLAIKGKNMMEINLSNMLSKKERVVRFLHR